MDRCSLRVKSDYKENPLKKNQIWLTWCHRFSQQFRLIGSLNCKKWQSNYFIGHLTIDTITQSLHICYTTTPREYDVIGIDEGQFFPDVVTWCEEMANRSNIQLFRISWHRWTFPRGKIVLVAGLDGTFQRVPFPEMLALVPLAEAVTKLQAVCMVCFQVEWYLNCRARGLLPHLRKLRSARESPRRLGWRWLAEETSTWRSAGAAILRQTRCSSEILNQVLLSTNPVKNEVSSLQELQCRKLFWNHHYLLGGGITKSGFEAA